MWTAELPNVVDPHPDVIRGAPRSHQVPLSVSTSGSESFSRLPPALPLSASRRGRGSVPPACGAVVSERTPPEETMNRALDRIRAEWLPVASDARATRGSSSPRLRIGVRPYQRRTRLASRASVSPLRSRGDLSTDSADLFASLQPASSVVGTTGSRPLEGKEDVFDLTSHDASKTRNGPMGKSAVRRRRSGLVVPVGTGTARRRRRRRAPLALVGTNATDAPLDVGWTRPSRPVVGSA